MFCNRKLLALGFCASTLIALAGCSGRDGLGSLVAIGFLSLAQETGESDWEEHGEVTYQEMQGDSLYVEIARDDGRRAVLTITDEGDTVRITGMVDALDGWREIDQSLENVDVTGDDAIGAELERSCLREEGC